MPKNTIAKPSCHINGTRPEDLRDGFIEVYRSLDAVAEKLKEHCPNGRDYYPQGVNVLDQAIKEHYDRLTTIRRMMDEMMSLAEHCSEFCKD